MDILEKIVASKRAGIELCKSEVPVAVLEKSDYFGRTTFSLANALTGGKGPGIIAEFKKKSPSKGTINQSADAAEVCSNYFHSGASAVSVLTNEEFFGGSVSDLNNVRKVVDGPVLRKEFVIDEYQVIESKSIGADAILLIADILTRAEMKTLGSLAGSLGLAVLYEIHDESGIAKLPDDASLVGINSRNLGNFSMNMSILTELIDRLPDDCIKIAESGIDSPQTLLKLAGAGFEGFLIGELFMKESDPGMALSDFLKGINNHKK